MAPVGEGLAQDAVLFRSQRGGFSVQERMNPCGFDLHRIVKFEGSSELNERSEEVGL